MKNIKWNTATSRARVPGWILLLLAFSLITFQCEKSADISSDAPSGEVGKGGSLNRFAVIGDFLYVLDDENIQTYTLTGGVMEPAGTASVSNDIETLYPFENYLLIGSRTGMYIYEVDESGLPVFVAAYEHLESCDPVVTDGTYAYVTLSSGTVCNRAINQLDILNIEDVFNPVLLDSYPMHRPKGLGVDGDLLFICDSEEGLKIYNAENTPSIQLIKQFDHFTAVDVIPSNGLLLVVGTTHLYQFDYSNPDDIKEISNIKLGV